MIDAAVTGFLVRDLDGLRMSKAGKPWLGFTVGVGQGEEVQWVRVTCFGPTAEELVRRLHRGSRIYAEGPLRLEEWKSKEGVLRHSLRLTARRIELLNQIGRNRPRAKPKSNRTGPAPMVEEQHGPNDDMPF